MQTPIRTEAGFKGLTPPRGLVTRCTDHCSMRVAQGIKGPRGFDVIPTFLPRFYPDYKKSEQNRGQFPMTLVTLDEGCACYPI